MERKVDETRVMTTDEVKERDLTESETCSRRCQHCNGRVWWFGEIWSAPGLYLCPYCGNIGANLESDEMRVPPDDET